MITQIKKEKNTASECRMLRRSLKALLEGAFYNKSEIMLHLVKKPSDGTYTISGGSSGSIYSIRTGLAPQRHLRDGHGRLEIAAVDDIIRKISGKRTYQG